MLRVCAISAMRGTPRLTIAGLLVVQNTAPTASIILATSRSWYFVGHHLAKHGLVGACRLALGEAAYWITQLSVPAALRSAAGGNGLVAQEVICGGGMAGALLLLNRPEQVPREAHATAAAEAEPEWASEAAARSDAGAEATEAGMPTPAHGSGRPADRRRVWRRRNWWA